MRKPSFLLQFLIGLAVVVLIAQTILLLVFTQKIRNTLQSETVSNLKVAESLLSQWSGDQIEKVFLGASQKPETAVSNSDNYHLSFFDLNGHRLGSSQKAGTAPSTPPPEIEKALQSGMGWSIRSSPPFNKETLYFASTFAADGKALGFLRLDVPVEGLSGVLDNLFFFFFFVSLTLLFVVFGSAFFYSKDFSRHIQRLIANAGRFAQGLEYEKTFIEKPLELKLLAMAMNKMFDQLQDRINTIRRQKNQLEAILEGMIEAVIVLDKKDKVITWNSAAGALFPTERSPLGRSLLEVTRNSELDTVVQDLLSGRVRETRLNILLHDVETTLQVQGAGLYYEKGELWGAVLVISDVSQLVRLESVRRDFVANVSHELKTPITNILGFVETLESGALDDPQKARPFLKIISRHAERLKLIVEDLLILSKIENRPAKEWERESAVLQEVLTAAAGVCHKKLNKKGLRLRYDVPEQEIVATVHPLLLEQAVVNLLDNAIKFSPEETTITLSLKDQEKDWSISVSDQGPGIPEKEKDRIFERFYRTERGREKEGTGLGLSIVKHIIVLHRGSVLVQSPVPGKNKGTRFTLILPKALASFPFEQED